MLTVQNEWSMISTMGTSEDCDITALFFVFSETNEHQNLMRFRPLISTHGKVVREVVRSLISSNYVLTPWRPTD